jgi:uncharacterized protein YceH (UPF0502 family)
VDLNLDTVEGRVLGCLLEKEITTPEYYPLTLNALVNACNQKSNRDPVVSYDDAAVEDALEGLRHHGLSYELTGGGNRVPKYGHRIVEALNLGRRELAILCVLILRGPQTVGELKDRTERMHSFSDLDEVHSVLARLIERSPALAVQLPKLPGTKEPRYAHLLSGPVDVSAPPMAMAPERREDRVSALEADVARLREALEDLQRQFGEFRKQFE